MGPKRYPSYNGCQPAIFGEVILFGVPDLEDISVMSEVLRILGAKVKERKIPL